MFDRKELTRLVGLHDRSYRLFTWLNESLKWSKRSYSSVGKALSFADAAAEWLRKNRQELPDDVRPAAADLDEFSSLFVSYLSTSFEIADNRVVSACAGCFCCGALNLSRHLRVRNPDRKARRVAGELKIIYLRRLAEELELPLIDSDFKEILSGAKESYADISLATYAQELKRRSQYASQGEGVLVLWREFAWTPKGGLKRKFRLKVEDIMKAEKRVADRLREWSNT